MPSVELSAGPIDYEDTGGPGPVLVLLHGPPMDGRLWRRAMPHLGGFRVIRPTLPLGGHRQPMHADADLSQLGMAAILGDFIDALDLHDVTLVLNDWGGGQFLINAGRTDRIARMALVACEAFDNYPPKAARPLGALAKVPPLFTAALQTFRFHRVRQADFGYGGMSVDKDYHLYDDLLLGWFAPALTDRAIRRDFMKFARGAPSKRELLELAEAQQKFTKPVLVVWADQDTMMPAEHGPRLAAHYPDARLETVENSSTLVPIDQPELLAGLLRSFVG
ncbi:pimeloyl-ACP methyl ester carboxylesterase [Nocardioides albertanoniae]|uniref:Pimeloyl-ACP methyl ester carboxylesterase n=1 Tax=Nocardioides albertanoniae TaxID=1175486 RepID=A0A543A0M9_9ACTN|nr:alpha/beta hydrolase [Nocardioides albertanoniae]TQL66162.1 pimeloyl-ACP methyl ester carboxylesterase [Nocardioides albertanoniae]